MQESAPEKSESKLRRLLRYTWFIHVGVALAIAWIFFLRWDENQRIERRAREKKMEKKLEEDRQAVEFLGGNRFEVLQFYAIPGIVSRGETAQLCNGVSNAKSARIEPRPKEGVWPSLNRCVEVAPAKDTTYTLTIDDGKGDTKTATAEVKVR